MNESVDLLEIRFIWIFELDHGECCFDVVRFLFRNACLELHDLVLYRLLRDLSKE